MSARCAITEQAADAHKKVWGRKAIWATFEIHTDEKENREARAVSVGKSNDTLQDCLKTLNDKKCLFILYDHKSTGKLGRQLEKTHFIFWSPKNSSQQERMMYSAYLVNFREDLKYADHMTCNEEEDFKVFIKETDESDEESDKDEPEPDFTPQAEFIHWLNSVGIPVKNLTTDFRDGQNLFKLVKLLDPGIVVDVNTNDALIFVGKLIEVAKDKFKIPAILDAADMVEKPNNLTNMTYLSFYREKYLHKELEEIEDIIEPTPEPPKPVIDPKKDTNCPVCGKLLHGVEEKPKDNVLEKELENLKNTIEKKKKKAKKKKRRDKIINRNKHKKSSRN